MDTTSFAHGHHESVELPTDVNDDMYEYLAREGLEIEDTSLAHSPVTSAASVEVIHPGFRKSPVIHTAAVIDYESSSTTHNSSLSGGPAAQKEQQSWKSANWGRRSS